MYTIHDKSTQEDMACFLKGKKIMNNCNNDWCEKTIMIDILCVKIVYLLCLPSMLTSEIRVT